MAKFKKGLVNDIRDEYDREEKQKKLREKYETPEDVLIVEKDNTVKFFVRTTGNVIKLVVGIIIFILAVIGLTAIIYPETRNELIHQGMAIMLKKCCQLFLGKTIDVGINQTIHGTNENIKSLLEG